MEKKTPVLVKISVGLFLLTLVINLVLVSIIIFKKPFSKERKVVSQDNLVEPAATPESEADCTLYTNEEYGFSLCYPATWFLPKEARVSPPQQLLYQVTFNPGGEEYLVDIYNPMLPISLGSFIRDYFKDVESGVGWTNEIVINGQKAIQFFVPHAGTVPVGMGGVAFRKDDFVLTITAPLKSVPSGDPKQLVTEPVLTQLGKSFSWLGVTAP